MAKKPQTAKIEFVHVDELTPSPRNARTHSPDQLNEIAASIEEFGWTMPLLIEDNADHTIIAGHGRDDGAKAIYARGGSIRMADGTPVPKDHVPVVVARGWTEKQKRAYALADNKIPMNAGWDQALLRTELVYLQAVDVDLKLLGFTDIELVSFMAAPPSGEDPEAEVEPPENPVSKPGDLWILGKHRILCGDSTKAEDVTRALDGAKPMLMVTDQPYGVDYDADWRNDRDRANGKPYGARAVGKVENDNRADWRSAYELFKGDVAYCWSADLRSRQIVESLESCGFEMRAQIIWVKDRLIISRGDYHFMHEPCWYAVRKGKTGHWAGDRKQTTVWEIPHRKSETGHSTQKPIDCMRRPILNNSNPGDSVYEPFAGSGTTVIACEMENRSCRALEISPVYTDVCAKRWMDFSKGTATLAGDGRTFDEIAKDRLRKTSKAKPAKLAKK